MANPYLPTWEYIPDGEPRVFGDRIYVYGSHDRVNSERFCDYKLKVWSAPLSNPTNWTCHGDCFHTRADRDHATDTDWTDHELYAPDVVEKDGKYYLYAYIVGAHGCVAVSDRPEGPFELLGRYDASEQYEDIKNNPNKYLENPDALDDYLVNGQLDEQGTHLEIALRDMKDAIMIDPGVLVDDDGRVYVYCGYLHSYMFEVDPTDMRTVIPGSYKKDILPKTEPFCFFEACSPRKIGDTYYLIYSPRHTSRLAYATSDSPTGPFTYRGYIVDNADGNVGGNDHGSIALINDEWYIFYHRMTNNTIMSRRGCVDRTKLLPDGTFECVKMTSHGLEKALNPYQETKAELACVLKGPCYIAEKNIFNRPIINITGGSVIGYRSFDFGEDYSGTSLKLFLELEGCCQSGIIKVHFDSEEQEAVASGVISQDNSVLRIDLPSITGVHDLFFTFETGRTSWIKGNFDNRELCRLNRFVFCK